MNIIGHRRIHLLLFFTFICFISTLSQKLSIEDIENRLVKHIRIDTTKINLLNEAAYQLLANDTDKAKSYADQAQELIKQLNYPAGKAKNLWIIGLLTLKTDKKAALEYFRQALHLAKSVNNQTDVCNYLIAISNVSKELNNVETSELSLDSALQIASTLKDPSLHIKILYNISSLLSSKGNHPEAIEKLQQTIRMANETDNKQVLPKAYSKIAFILRQQGCVTQAMEYYILASQIYEQQKDTQGAFNCLINIAGIKSELKEYQSALETINQALLLAKKNNNPNMQSICLTNIGFIYQQIKHPEALQYLLDALKLVEEKNISQNINLLINIGSTYIDLGKFEEARQSLNEALDKAQKANIKFAYGEALSRLSNLYYTLKQYGPAIDYANRALEVGNETQYVQLEKNSHKLLADIYAAIGNYDKAYHNHIQFKLLNDSILNDKSIRKITLLENTYKYEKERQLHEKETAQQQQKIKSQYYLILILIVVIFLLFTLSYQFYRSNRLKKQVLRLEVDKINNELEYNRREMVSSSLRLIQNSESDTHCVKILESIEKNTNETDKGNIRSLISHYKNKSLHTNWQEFETLFLKVNPDFYNKLNENFPGLTPNERKLCIFLKLNMSNKNISQITFQSEEALKKARMRLRKKLRLDREENLSSFIQNF